MAQFQRDTRLLHPILQSNLQAIINRIKSELPVGFDIRMISAHRTVEEQFELFKQGRVFSGGTWRKKPGGKTVTNIDGFTKKSNHNYLPCLSMDFGIFDDQNKYLGESPFYRKIELGSSITPLEWGGNWVSLKDQPHLEIPKNRLFKSDKVLDTNLQWQRYLKKSGEYTGAMDGMFGNRSVAALKRVSGFETQTVEAWRFLFDNFGPIPE